MKATFDVTKNKWDCAWKMQKPETYIAVKDGRPHIMLLKAGIYYDITDLIPDGRTAAELAVRTFAKYMPTVGWFPASVEIKKYVKDAEKEITDWLVSTGQIKKRL